MRKKEKVVGILSMQRILNYGSFMQALGLKLMIESLGFKTVFVDYHIGKKFSKQNIRNSRPYKLLRKLLAAIKPIEENAIRDAIASQYSILGLDEKYHYRTKTDTLVIGSDEVFNYIQKGQNVGYSPELLGINSRAGKVISYAASCGNLDLERLKRYNKVTEFSDAVSRMSAVSVRDYNTYNLICNITAINPIMHLDPVLLADFSDYLQDNVSIHDYILVYGYTGRFTEKEGKAIMEYAGKIGKSVYVLGGEQTFSSNTIVCKPLEVMAYFKHAYMVITDTFHGTIFSVVSEKNVVVLVRPGEEGNENKLSSLMEQLGIEDKRLYDLDQLEVVADKAIDYDSIRKYRKNEKERAMEYLSLNL